MSHVLAGECCTSPPSPAVRVTTIPRLQLPASAGDGAPIGAPGLTISCAGAPDGSPRRSPIPGRA